jgi:branched-chain amino acid transport system ATP-binding protein
MLVVRDLQAFYGKSHVLHGVSLDVSPGEVVSLLGRNGAGKTTTLKSIIGVVGDRRGTITLDGRDITGLSSDRIAKLGIAWVPEERAIFSTLTVKENLELPPALRPGGWSVERIYQTFPILKERGAFPGTKMSGGEQQMLAMMRVLRAAPRLLLLDEPSEGLAPVIVQRIAQMILELKAQGLATILVEQNLRFALKVADRHVLMVDGRSVETLTTAEVKTREKELLDHLSV